MKKCIKNFLVVFMMFVFFSGVCFSAQLKKVSRQKAMDLIYFAIQNYPCASYFYSMECPNCHKETSEHGYYFITTDNIIFSFIICTYCKYLEVGYTGDEKTNPGGTLYKGTK